jgi:hypothetical protein
MTTNQMKPSYLGLLKAVSIAEADAEKYFCAWAATTKDAGVRAVLECVALRGESTAWRSRSGSMN